jgi:hypothetical protein
MRNEKIVLIGKLESSKEKIGNHGISVKFVKHFIKKMKKQKVS